MKDELCRYTLRVEKELLDKFGYIAEYEGRTKNRELEQMIKKRIRDFEKEHGLSTCSSTLAYRSARDIISEL